MLNPFAPSLACALSFRVDVVVIKCMCSVTATIERTLLTITKFANKPIGLKRIGDRREV